VNSGYRGELDGDEREKRELDRGRGGKGTKRETVRLEGNCHLIEGENG